MTDVLPMSMKWKANGGVAACPGGAVTAVLRLIELPLESS